MTAEPSPKRKVEPREPSQRKLDQIFPPRKFEILTPMSTDRCAERVQQLEMFKHRHLYTWTYKRNLRDDQWRVVVWVVQQGRDLYDYVLRVQRAREGLWKTSIRVDGVIVRDKGLEKTSIRGTVRVVMIWRRPTQHAGPLAVRLIATASLLIFVSGFIVGLSQMPKGMHVELTVMSLMFAVVAAPFIFVRSKNGWRSDVHQVQRDYRSITRLLQNAAGKGYGRRLRQHEAQG